MGGRILLLCCCIICINGMQTVCEKSFFQKREDEEEEEEEEEEKKKKKTVIRILSECSSWWPGVYITLLHKTCRENALLQQLWWKSCQIRFVCDNQRKSGEGTKMKLKEHARGAYIDELNKRISFSHCMALWTHAILKLGNIQRQSRKLQNKLYCNTVWVHSVMPQEFPTLSLDVI